MNKNLQTEFILLCDYGMISKEGKVTAAGIFEELLNAAPPIVLSKGFVVATVSGAPSTNYKMALKVEGKDKKNLIPNVEVDIKTGPNGKSNLVIEIQGINFPEPGTYSFRLYSDGDEIGSRDLIVKRVNREEGKMSN
jgi:hypothetical protein